MISIIGATGFVGAALTKQLVRTGEPVRILVRDGEKARTRLGEIADSVEIVVGDMHDPAALDRLLEGSEAVYVLVQTVTARQPHGAGDYIEAEQQAMAGIIAAAHRTGVSRLLTVGLIGATSDARNPWVRSRARLEAQLLASHLDVTVLRAGLIVGAGGTGFDRLKAAATRRTAVILGNGNQRWSYLALDDLVGYLSEARNNPASYGAVWDVGSREAPTYRELLARTAAVQGIIPPQVVTLPLGLVIAVAPVLEWAGRLPHRGLRNAIDHLGDDLIGDTTAVRRHLPRNLLGWDEAVRSALETVPAVTG